MSTGPEQHWIDSLTTAVESEPLHNNNNNNNNDNEDKIPMTYLEDDEQYAFGTATQGPAG